MVYKPTNITAGGHNLAPHHPHDLSPLSQASGGPSADLAQSIQHPIFSIEIGKATMKKYSTSNIQHPILQTQHNLELGLYAHI